MKPKRPLSLDRYIIAFAAREAISWGTSANTLQPTLVDCISHDVGAAVEAKLFADTALVRLDCFDADVELAGDFLVRVSSGDQYNDLRFTLA